MIKVKVFVLLNICLIPLNFYSQQDRATIIFKDSTSIDGLAKITKSGAVKFRKKIGDKKIKYSFDDLSAVKIVDNKGLHRYYQVEVVDESNPKILELIIQGKAYLYKIASSKPGPLTNFSVGNSNIPIPHKIETTAYFLRIEGERKAYRVSNLVSDKTFQSFILEKFSDCEEFSQKFEPKDITEKNIIKIIDFYNSCND